MLAALTQEPASDRVRIWLRGLAAGDAFVSDWVTTEVSSALALKVRVGGLSLAERAAALAAYQQMVVSSLHLLPVDRDHFRAAARYVDGIVLRAAGALHLALCADHGLTLHTLDARLHQACLTVGVAAVAL